MLFDTPGQIEVFTWSASGAIITESLASSFPTVVAYIMDTARCVNPVTFMSNMLYACSIMYRTKLPFIVVLNKVGILTSIHYSFISLCQRLTDTQPVFRFLNVFVTRRETLCIRRLSDFLL